MRYNPFRAVFENMMKAGSGEQTITHMEFGEMGVYCVNFISQLKHGELTDLTSAIFSNLRLKSLSVYFVCTIS